MTVLSLSPVAAGVYLALNVAALQALAVGGIFDDVPQGTTFPYVWFTVSEEHVGGFGTTHGPVQLNLRVEAASTYGGNKELQAILNTVKALLKDAALVMVGWRMCGHVFYAETVEPFDSVLGGVKCREAAANFYFFVEPA